MRGIHQARDQEEVRKIRANRLTHATSAQSNQSMSMELTPHSFHFMLQQLSLLYASNTPGSLLPQQHPRSCCSLCLPCSLTLFRPFYLVTPTSLPQWFFPHTLALGSLFAVLLALVITYSVSISPLGCELHSRRDHTCVSCPPPYPWHHHPQ